MTEKYYYLVKAEYIRNHSSDLCVKQQKYVGPYEMT